ncbi:response regulator [Roseicyclus persicicus]|uniref:Response regulator n=1 Tax=Roseicyclus persicicus TaxID=2650661 RepID=A0A7X6H0S5_9RHOB|nr:response regulator [Roseibacterium persicicum]NKX45924.1 response regulator [Roseibacterium persicicum]
MSDKTPLILHADDEEDILAIAKLALEVVGGLSIVQCSSGHQAIELAQRHKPDFLLLDVMMPGIDGVETLRRIRQIEGCHRTPAVFMTAKVLNDDRARLLASGAEAVIAKPFDPMTLASQIVEIWRKSIEKECLPG